MQELRINRSTSFLSAKKLKIKQRFLAGWTYALRTTGIYSGQYPEYLLNSFKNYANFAKLPDDTIKMHFPSIYSSLYSMLYSIFRLTGIPIWTIKFQNGVLFGLVVFPWIGCCFQNWWSRKKFVLLAQWPFGGVSNCAAKFQELVASSSNSLKFLTHHRLKHWIPKWSDIAHKKTFYEFVKID